MFFGIEDIAESQWGNETTDGGPETATVSTRLAGESDGIDGRNVELWSSYGFACRPAAGTDGAVCQALTVDHGGRKIAVATRDLRGADCHGALNEGDVVMWSVGKNTIRCNADGSIGLIKQGTTDAGISIEKDGTILLYNEWGQIQIGPDGISMFTAAGEALSLGKGAFVALASQASIACGAVGLGVGAAVPLTFSPTSGVVKPAPNVFI